MLPTFEIDQPKGSYRNFRDEDPNFPLAGVTYPTDYGYLPGYVGEDECELDAFVGTGNCYGYIRVKRSDVEGGKETKFLLGLTLEEVNGVRTAFAPVIDGFTLFSPASLGKVLRPFKSR